MGKARVTTVAAPGSHATFRNSLRAIGSMGYVYILTNASWARTLYIGVTADLTQRVAEHRCGLITGFSSKYRCHRLVSFERFGDIRDAIAREKQRKGWRRARKLELIEAFNPRWRDLSNPSDEVLRRYAPQDDEHAQNR